MLMKLTLVDSYRPTRKEYLIFNLKLGAFNFSQTVINVLAPEYQAARVYDLYNFYTLQDLTSHPAVIMLPYSVMSYRLTELYTMGIPLFIPSISADPKKSRPYLQLKIL